MYSRGEYIPHFTTYSQRFGSREMKNILDIHNAKLQQPPSLPSFLFCFSLQFIFLASREINNVFIYSFTSFSSHFMLIITISFSPCFLLLHAVPLYQPKSCRCRTNFDIFDTIYFSIQIRKMC